MRRAENVQKFMLSSKPPPDQSLQARATLKENAVTAPKI